MKKLKWISSALVVMLMMSVLVSCNDETGTEPTIDDSELIAAIESAESKVEISSNALPGGSNTLLESDFAESFVARAQLASELGYEVTLRVREGVDVGEEATLFFDLNGRELNDEQGFGQGNRRRGRNARRARGIRNCFDFVFPVALTMPDDSEISLSAKEDWTLIRDWYQANPDAEERPSFVFPLQIVFGEETLTINNQEEFQEAKSACEVDRRRGRCFELVFPITFTMPDGSEITLQSKEDWTLIDAWYESNPDVEERPDMVFPVDVMYRNDSIVTFNSNEEILGARAECETNRGRSACFGLVFPVTFEMPDGSEITLASKEEHQLIKAWYRANPDADERPDLVFPVDITFEDGSSLTISSQEELQAAKADCG